MRVGAYSNAFFFGDGVIGGSCGEFLALRMELLPIVPLVILLVILLPRGVVLAPIEVFLVGAVVWVVGRLDDFLFLLGRGSFWLIGRRGVVNTVNLLAHHM